MLEIVKLGPYKKYVKISNKILLSLEILVLN